MSKSSKSPKKRPPKQVRVKKPHPDFPLFPHASNRWVKKIRGKFHYFGSTLNDRDGRLALAKWLEQKDDLLAGRVPRDRKGELRIVDLVNAFLTAKTRLLESGEIVQRTFDDYKTVCKRVLGYFGNERYVEDMLPADFEAFRNSFAKNLNPTSTANVIQRVRIIFKYGFDQGLMDKPIRYGQGFQKPSAKVLRKLRADKGTQMFDAKLVFRMTQEAAVPLKTMILLGINCGFGNGDCGNLAISSIDFNSGWIQFPRPKTGVARRNPLWPETIASIKESIAERVEPKYKIDKDRLFTTAKGLSWAKEGEDNPVSKQFRTLLKSLNAHTVGKGFYCLRRTFATVAGETGDQVAVNYLMGHSPIANDMSAIYRQGISDERLVAVTNFVRDWYLAGARKTRRHK